MQKNDGSSLVARDEKTNDQTLNHYNIPNYREEKLIKLDAGEK